MIMYIKRDESMWSKNKGNYSFFYVLINRGHIFKGFMRSKSTFFNGGVVTYDNCNFTSSTLIVYKISVILQKGYITFMIS